MDSLNVPVGAVMPPTGRRRPSVDERPSTPNSDQGAVVHPLELRRLAAGYLTPAAFAKAASLDRNTISGIESHDGRRVRGSNLDKMANALRVDITVLAREFRDPAAGLLAPQQRIVTPTSGPRR